MTTETNTVIESLAAKLAAADLDEAETALLHALIVEPGEVEGFVSGKRQHEPITWSDTLNTATTGRGIEVSNTNGIIAILIGL